MDANFICLLNEIERFDVAFDNLRDRCKVIQWDCISILRNKANNNDITDAMHNTLFNVEGLINKCTDNGGDDAPMDLSMNSHKTMKVSRSNSDSHNGSEDSYTLTGSMQGTANSSTFTHYHDSMENDHDKHMHPLNHLTKGKPHYQAKPNSGKYQNKNIKTHLLDTINDSAALNPPNIKMSNNLVTEVSKMQHFEINNQIMLSNENMKTTVSQHGISSCADDTSTSNTTNQECCSNISCEAEQHIGEQYSLGILHSKNKGSQVCISNLGKSKHSAAQQCKCRKHNCHSDTKMQHITDKHQTTKRSLETTVSTGNSKAMVKNSSPMETVYTCVVCQKQFIDLLHLSFHINTHLEAHQKYCTICSEKFLYRENLKKHIVVHCLVSPFPCGHCAYTFTSCRARTRHINAQHKKHNHYACSFCGKVYSYRKHFLKHLEQHKS